MVHCPCDFLLNLIIASKSCTTTYLLTRVLTNHCNSFVISEKDLTLHRSEVLCKLLFASGPDMLKILLTRILKKISVFLVIRYHLLMAGGTV